MIQMTVLKEEKVEIKRDGKRQKRDDMRQATVFGDIYREIVKDKWDKNIEKDDRRSRDTRELTGRWKR